MKWQSIKRGIIKINVPIYRMRRGSRPVVFCKKGVLKDFTKFTGK